MISSRRINVNLSVDQAQAIVRARDILMADPTCRCAIVGAGIYQDLARAVAEVSEALVAAA